MRRSLPMALTIAVHMLLAAGFYFALRHPRPNSLSGPQSILLMIAPRLAPSPEAQADARTEHRAAPQTATPGPPPRQSAAIEAPPASEAAAAPLPEALPGAGEIMARLKRDAGKIDRELRGGTRPPPLSADAPLAHFERAMAAAWIDRSNSVREDRYVSPDGVVITRLTRNGGAECYMSGTVNFVPGILHDSARPQTVKCPPADSGWTRR